MVEVLSQVNLPLLETAIPFLMEARSGTGSRRIRTEGNSVLSSLCVVSLDAGASVRVWYTDTTTGEVFGESYFLGEHQTIDGTYTLPHTDRATITRIHNKTEVNYEVLGGSATFGVYITVVSSFATDLDAALVADLQTFREDSDKAIPIAGIDPVSGLFRIVRIGDDGRIGVSATATSIEHQLSGSSTMIAAGGGTDTLVNYTVPTGKRFVWLGGKGFANSTMLWEVSIDGTLWLPEHYTYDKPVVDLYLGAPKNIEAGSILQVKATNNNLYGEDATDVRAHIYGVIEDV